MMGRLKSDQGQLFYEFRVFETVRDADVVSLRSVRPQRRG